MWILLLALGCADRELPRESPPRVATARDEESAPSIVVSEESPRRFVVEVLRYEERALRHALLEGGGETDFDLVVLRRVGEKEPDLPAELRLFLAHPEADDRFRVVGAHLTISVRTEAIKRVIAGGESFATVALAEVIILAQDE